MTLAELLLKVREDKDDGLNNYLNQVVWREKNSFFNNNGNNPIQWAGKVVQDVQKRGWGEGLQDLSYPILTKPYIEPLVEPVIGGARVANYKAGRPYGLINKLLGQTDDQVVPRIRR